MCRVFLCVERMCFSLCIDFMFEIGKLDIIRVIDWCVGVNIFNQVWGIVKGGVLYVYIVVYKVCWQGGGCDDLDILVVMDDVIVDGVDVFLVFFGSDLLFYFYYLDVIVVVIFYV